jgi:hypothetical protein
MTVYELLEKRNGFILINKAIVVVDGEEVVVGQFDGPDMVFTEAGNELAAIVSNEPAARAPRKPRAAAVESVEPQPQAEAPAEAAAEVPAEAEQAPAAE